MVLILLQPQYDTTFLLCVEISIHMAFQNNLPAITSVDDVGNMTGAQLQHYYVGYIGIMPHNLAFATRRRRILNAIGHLPIE